MEPRFAACSVAHAAFVVRAHRRMLPLPAYFRLPAPPAGTLYGLIARAAENVINTLLVHVQRLHVQRPSAILTQLAFAIHAVRGDITFLYETPHDTPAWEGLSYGLCELLSSILPTDDVVYSEHADDRVEPQAWLIGSPSHTRDTILNEAADALRWLRSGPPDVRPVKDPLPPDLHRSVCALHDASKLCWRLAESLITSGQSDLVGCNAYACAANYGVLFEWTIDLLLSGAKNLAPFRAQLYSMPVPRPSVQTASVGVQTASAEAKVASIEAPRKRARNGPVDVVAAWDRAQRAGVEYLLKLFRSTDASFQTAREIPHFFFTTVLLLAWKTRDMVDIGCRLEYVYGQTPAPFYTQFRVRGELPWPALLSKDGRELLPSIPQGLCDEALRVYCMIPTRAEGFVEDWPEPVRGFLTRVIHSRWLDSKTLVDK